MINSKNIETTGTLERQPQLVTPIAKPLQFLENTFDKVPPNLYLDFDDNENEESNDCCNVPLNLITNPLDYRLDWSKDWVDESANYLKEGPIPSGFYTLLQETISTIDPYDDNSEDDNSFISLETTITSDIFNVPLNLSNVCDELSPVRINNDLKPESTKRRKMN